MSLASLPNEIVHAIADDLDLRSLVRLAATNRSLASAHLIANHCHGRAYLALRRNDLVAFQKETMKIKQPLDHLEESLPVMERRHIDLHFLLVACAWVLVVDHCTTSEAWWLAWSLMARRLGTVAEFADIQMASSVSRAVVHMMKRAMEGQRGDRLAALRVFCERAAVAGHRWVDPDNLLGPTLASIYATAQALPWTILDRVDLLAQLTSVSTTSISPIFGSPDPTKPLEETVAKMNQLSCVLEFVTACHRIDRRSVLSLTALLGASASCGNRSLFDLIISSYIVGVAAFTPVDSHPFVRLNFPATTDVLIGQLEDRYTQTYGVPKSAVRPFLKYLSYTSFEQVLLPYMLGVGQRLIPTFLPMELEWLFTHVHIHPAMLHFFAFNNRSTCAHTPETIQLLLDHVPIDIEGYHHHSTDAPYSVRHSRCDWCQDVMYTARITSKPLPSFTTGVWHVSYNPIPTATRAADQRAISSVLTRSPPARKSTTDHLGRHVVQFDLEGPKRKAQEKYRHAQWMAYVHACHKDFARAGAVGGPPDKHTAPPRVRTAIRWDDPARAINTLDIRSALFACLYEFRFDDAMAVIARMAREEKANKFRVKVFGLTRSTVWLLREVVAGAESPLEMKEEQLDGVAHVLAALDEGGFVDVEALKEDVCAGLMRRARARDLVHEEDLGEEEDFWDAKEDQDWDEENFTGAAE